MKTCATLLLFLPVALPSAGQSDKDNLFKIRDNSRKFGFINRAGAVVIPPKYDSVGETHEGRIPVWLAQKAGYVDLSGKVVIELKYDSPSSRAVK
jgi:WG repeat protein